jgi:hypothetical protein
MYFDEYRSAWESQLSTVLGMTMVIGHLTRVRFINWLKRWGYDEVSQINNKTGRDLGRFYYMIFRVWVTTLIQAFLFLRLRPITKISQTMSVIASMIKSHQLNPFSLVDGAGWGKAVFKAGTDATAEGTATGVSPPMPKRVTDVLVGVGEDVGSEVAGKGTTSCVEVGVDSGTIVALVFGVEVGPAFGAGVDVGVVVGGIVVGFGI